MAWLILQNSMTPIKKTYNLEIKL